MDNTQAHPLVVRRAAAADAAALTRLREVMLSDTGMLATGADPGWRDKAEAWFAERTSAWSAARPRCATDTPPDRATPVEISLNATGHGIAMYRSLGFTESRYPVLQLRLTRPARKH